ncbi:hypothetical protein DL96DRAFT_1568231 [Flagelloscypha sp. PMI_526]|nr:hypothetical protein DL96DRAFT_1568231 [Flagelloscypha sp. PMI_526]
MTLHLGSAAGRIEPRLKRYLSIKESTIFRGALMSKFMEKHLQDLPWYSFLTNSISRIFRRWVPAFIHLLFDQLTLLPLLHEVNTPKLPLLIEDLAHCSECLSMRSKIVMNGFRCIQQLAIIAISWATSVNTPSCIIGPFIILLWSFMNRTYYEGLPLDEFQKRVRSSTPQLVASLYAIPELYQVTFIISQIATHGHWVNNLVVGIVFGIHVGIRVFASYRAERRRVRGIIFSWGYGG